MGYYSRAGVQCSLQEGNTPSTGLYGHKSPYSRSQKNLVSYAFPPLDFHPVSANPNPFEFLEILQSFIDPSAHGEGFENSTLGVSYCSTGPRPVHFWLLRRQACPPPQCNNCF